MKPRWISEDGAAPPTVVDATLIARWLPGRYYRISTISTIVDENSSKTRPYAALVNESSILSTEVLPKFATHVFKCAKLGVPIDFHRPIYEVFAETEDEAKRNHRDAVSLFSKCSLSEAQRQSQEVERRHPEFALFPKG